jgi:hypothetical protein
MSNPTEVHVEERGLEYCDVCDDLTEIAVRSHDRKVCYACADEARATG